MGLQRPDDQVPMSEINVTPLVDVMLVLLVVFIVTAPLLMQAVKVNLPKTAAVAAVAETQSVRITVDAAGLLYVDNRPMAVSDLEDTLRVLVQTGTVDVLVHADAQVSYGQVAQVMAAVQRAGVPRLLFSTAAASPGARTLGASAH